MWFPFWRPPIIILLVFKMMERCSKELMFKKGKIHKPATNMVDSRFPGDQSLCKTTLASRYQVSHSKSLDIL